MTDKPTLGNCMKCNTYGELFEYSSGYFIGKSDGCWEEEEERNSGQHIINNEKLEEYKRLVQATGG